MDTANTISLSQRPSHEVTEKGCPRRVAPEKSDVPVAQPYFSLRDELVLEEELVFTGLCLAVPAAVRQEMMAMIHSTHIGIEDCLRRA